MAGSRLPIAERSSNPGRRPVSHLPDLSVQNLETIPGWDQPRSAAPAQACRFGVRGRFDRQAVPSHSALESQLVAGQLGGLAGVVGIDLVRASRITLSPNSNSLPKS